MSLKPMIDSSLNCMAQRFGSVHSTPRAQFVTGHCLLTVVIVHFIMSGRSGGISPRPSTSVYGTPYGSAVSRLATSSLTRSASESGELQSGSMPSSTVLALCRVGDFMWSGGADHHICVWDARSKTLVKKFLAHPHMV